MREDFMMNPVVEERRIEVGYSFLGKLCRALNIDERQMIGGINIDADAEGLVHVTVRRFMTVKEGEDVIECIRVMEER